MGITCIPLAQSVAPDCLREDDAEKKKTIFCPQGRKKRDKTKSAASGINSVRPYFRKVFSFFLPCLLSSLFESLSLNLARAISCSPWLWLFAIAKFSCNQSVMAGEQLLPWLIYFSGAHYLSKEKLHGQNKARKKRGFTVCERRVLNISIWKVLCVSRQGNYSLFPSKSNVWRQFVEVVWNWISGFCSCMLV